MSELFSWAKIKSGMSKMHDWKSDLRRLKNEKKSKIESQKIRSSVIKKP